MSSDALASADFVLGELKQRLLAHGFDLCAPLPIGKHLPGRAALEDFGLHEACGILVAHSQKLWEPFTRWHQQNRHREQPLDTYTETTLGELGAEAARALGQPGRYAVYFGHCKYPAPDGSLAPLGLQRLTEASGLASLGPAHLNVHPEVGPWLGLRALLVLPLSFEVARQQALGPALQARPCDDCSEKPCQPALAAALRTPLSDPLRWKRWLAVRDACPVGRQQRYSEAQIRFHYAGVGAPALQPAATPLQPAEPAEATSKRA